MDRRPCDPRAVHHCGPKHAAAGGQRIFRLFWPVLWYCGLNSGPWRPGKLSSSALSQVLALLNIFSRIYLLILCVHGMLWGDMHDTAHVQRSEAFCELVLSFHHTDPQDWIRPLASWQQCLLPPCLQGLTKLHRLDLNSVFNLGRPWTHFVVRCVF